MNPSTTLAAIAPDLGDRVHCHVLVDGQPPLFIEPAGAGFGSIDDFSAWVAAHRPRLDALIVAHGGIVLRGMPIVTTQDMSRIMSHFPIFQQSYAGGQSAREKLSDVVYEATQLDGRYRLMLHQEMFYVRDYPARIAFFARVAAQQGGETIIGDMRRLSRALPAGLRDKLEAKGVRNVRNFGPATGSRFHSGRAEERGWDFAFYTESAQKVEQICRGKGMVPIWNDDGSLTVVNTLDAFVTHPVTGERLYRNGLHGYGAKGLRRPVSADTAPAKEGPVAKKQASAMTLGDGSDIDAAEADALLQLVDDVTIVWPWQTGDLMILDNLQVAHGRNPFVGERMTEVSMLD